MPTRLLVMLPGAAAILSLLLPVAPAAATPCPPASVGGPAVAWVFIGGTRTPLKPVDYDHGEALVPPATSRAGGITGKPVGARSGTTVIAWHVRFGPGCPGRMNSLASAPIGTQFTLQARGGEVVQLAITGRTEVKNGRYRPSWFRPGGPYSVTLLTCGDLRDGVFRTTVVTFAAPVANTESPSSQPDAQEASTEPGL